MNWYAQRTVQGFLVLVAGSLAGCANLASQTVQITSEVISPTVAISPVQTASQTSVPPTSTTAPPSTLEIVPSPTEEPPPSPTPAPQAEVVLVLVDCLNTFCVPGEIELLVLRATDKPGVTKVEVISESHVRLVYDPTLLTEEDAVKTFADATRMEVQIEP